MSDKCAKKKEYLESILNGGIGYGKLCIPKWIVDLLLIVLFPPLYVIIYQLKQPVFDIKPIIANIILTSCFYFPGFIHAVNIKSKICGSLFNDERLNTRMEDM